MGRPTEDAVRSRSCVERAGRWRLERILPTFALWAVLGSSNPSFAQVDCTVEPEGTSCADGLFCTDPDTCQSGTCTGPPRNCRSAGAPPLGVDGVIGPEWAGTTPTFVPYSGGAAPDAQFVAFNVYLRADSNFAYVALEALPMPGDQWDEAYDEDLGAAAIIYVNTDLQNVADLIVYATLGFYCELDCYDPVRLTPPDWYNVGNPGLPSTAPTGPVGGVREVAVSWNLLINDPDHQHFEPSRGSLKIHAVRGFGDMNLSGEQFPDRFGLRSQVCNAVVCNEATDACEEQQVGGRCNDGLFCTIDEACDAGACVSAIGPDCSDGVYCTADGCNDETNDCHNSPDNSLCQDELFCNGVEICDPLNNCGPGTDPCDDGLACTIDSCDEAGDSCTHTPQTVLCDDGLYCNGIETCTTNSGCRPGINPCDDGFACTVDACNENNDICTHAANGAACTDNNPCTDDACDLALGCQHVSNTAPCDDGDPTTCHDVCAATACTGTPVAEPPDIDDSLRFSDKKKLIWSDPPGSYNVYRGSNGPGRPWVYNQSCMASGLVVATVEEPLVPPLDQCFYYLVARVDQCRESVIGRDSTNTPIPNDAPCP